MDTLQRKTRYANDSKYREKERARGRERYRRMKKLVLEKTGPKARPDEERFWEKVDKCGPNDCWEWKGASRNKSGYSTLAVDGRSMAAYRFSWILHFGPIDSETYVKIKCGNKLCVNPKHLYLNNLDGVRPEMIVDLSEQEAVERRQKAARKTREHYQKNKVAKQQYVQEYQMRRKLQAIAYLGGACACGYDYPNALQFHHRDPATKLFSITTKELSSLKKYPWDTVIIPELDKCDLLCANCHFREHGILTEEDIKRLRTEIGESDELEGQT